MSYQSLYRRYRPQIFAEVVGQSSVIDALSAQLKNDTISHAYLFSGSRGLGKTSIARIFAKELGVSPKDIYEIDAASNNSVDDIRALTENVYTLPFESKYKLYILDEAHMLSKSAWNAFLKTLEEPPSHALYILATTELHKIPETVQSRCQVFEFRKPTRDDVIMLVTRVAKKEGYTLGSGVADLVALLADGSYRDALSILEKVCSVSKDKMLTREEAERATGAPTHALVAQLVSAFHKGNAGEALTVLTHAREKNVDVSLFVMLVLELVRQVLLVRHAPELRAELKKELEDAYISVEEMALQKDSKLTHETLAALLDASARVRFSPIPTLPVELAVIALYGNETTPGES